MELQLLVTYFVRQLPTGEHNTHSCLISYNIYQQKKRKINVKYRFILYPNYYQLERCQIQPNSSTKYQAVRLGGSFLKIIESSPLKLPTRLQNGVWCMVSIRLCESPRLSPEAVRDLGNYGRPFETPNFVCLSCIVPVIQFISKI